MTRKTKEQPARASKRVWSSGIPGKGTPIIRAPKKKTGPVARIWAICDGMSGKPRSEVLAACRKAKINPATAATYYQLWRHRNDRPKLRAKRAA